MFLRFLNEKSRDYHGFFHLVAMQSLGYFNLHFEYKLIHFDFGSGAVQISYQIQSDGLNFLTNVVFVDSYGIGKFGSSNVRNLQFIDGGVVQSVRLAYGGLAATVKRAAAAAPGLPATRLGVTVTRKVGKAVKRNWIKRLVREAFRREHHALPAGLDMVWVAKRDAVDSTYEAVVHDMRALAGRLEAQRSRSSTTRAGAPASPRSR